MSKWIIIGGTAVAVGTIGYYYYSKHMGDCASSCGRGTRPNPDDAPTKSGGRKFQSDTPVKAPIKYKQFGVPLDVLPSTNVKGYTRGIPTVLVTLRDYLVAHGGLETDQIFRLAADAKEIERVKLLVDEDKFDKVDDINIVSTLIKVFFRDLPHHLVDIDSEELKMCSTEEKAAMLLEAIPEPGRSIALYFLDLCCEVVKKEKINKMTPKALAIVLAPNLYKLPNVQLGMSPQEGLAVMDLVKKLNIFWEYAIMWRMRTPAS